MAMSFYNWETARLAHFKKEKYAKPIGLICAEKYEEQLELYEEYKQDYQLLADGTITVKQFIRDRIQVHIMNVRNGNLYKLQHDCNRYGWCLFCRISKVVGVTCRHEIFFLKCLGINDTSKYCHPFLLNESLLQNDIDDDLEYISIVDMKNLECNAPIQKFDKSAFTKTNANTRYPGRYNKVESERRREAKMLAAIKRNEKIGVMKRKRR